MEAGLLQPRQDQDADKQVALNKGTYTLHFIKRIHLFADIIFFASSKSHAGLEWWEL